MKWGEKMIYIFNSFLTQIQIGDFENFKDLTFAPIFGERIPILITSLLMRLWK